MSSGGDIVDLAPFQAIVKQRIAQDELSWNDLAAKLGWTRVVGDHQRVKIALGVKRYISHGRHKYREGIRPETALKFCEALDLDPVEMGL